MLFLEAEVHSHKSFGWRYAPDLPSRSMPDENREIPNKRWRPSSLTEATDRLCWASTREQWGSKRAKVRFSTSIPALQRLSSHKDLLRLAVSSNHTQELHSRKPGQLCDDGTGTYRNVAQQPYPECRGNRGLFNARQRITPHIMVALRSLVGSVHQFQIALLEREPGLSDAGAIL